MADDAEDAEIPGAVDAAHDGLYLISFVLEGAEVFVVEFDGEFAFGAVDGFFHVVGDGL